MARTYRFFCRNVATFEHLAEGNFMLLETDEPEIFFQLTKVLRAKKDDTVVFAGIKRPRDFVESGKDSAVMSFFDFFYRVNEVSKKAINLVFEKKTINQNELDFKLGLIICLPNRPEKLEFILQKAVELGCSDIVGIKSDFSQMKHQLREDRLQKIMVEAAEQSERAIVPSFEVKENLRDFLKKSSSDSPQEFSNFWVAMERTNVHESASLPSLLQKNKNLTEVYLLIGPEGGFSPEEKELIQKLGLCCFSLGRRILRMETAAMVSLGVVGQYLET